MKEACTVTAHLVILKKRPIDNILNGRKTIESRFWKTRRPAFGRVSRADTLFLKLSSGPVCAKAKVSDVRCYENLTPGQIRRIRQQYDSGILGSDEYWLSKQNSRFAMLVWLTDVRPIDHIRIDKKDWRAWVMLTEGDDFGLLRANHAGAAV